MKQDLEKQLCPIKGIVDIGVTLCISVHGENLWRRIRRAMAALRGQVSLVLRTRGHVVTVPFGHIS